MAKVGGGNGNVDELFQQAVERDKRWRERKEDIKARLLGEDERTENEVKKKIEDAIETRRRHDELLTSTISAFGPNSRIYDETGWHILGAEPLYERDPSIPNPDALIGHDDRDTVLSIECKTGLSSPQNAIEQLRNAVETVKEHQDYLRDHVGIDFHEVEPVLCVPGRLAQRAREAIEREERENDVDQHIILWTLYMFQEETLQIHQNFDTRSATDSLPDNRIAEYLGGNEGMKVVDCPLLSNSFYPESSTYRIVRQVFFDVLIERGESDNSARKFTKGEVFDLIDDQRNVPHYATEEIAEYLTEDVISTLSRYGLIEPVDPSEGSYGDHVDLFQYSNSRVTGTQPQTILDNLQEAYKEAWIEQKAETEAREEVVEEVYGDQTTLADERFR